MLQLLFIRYNILVVKEKEKMTKEDLLIELETLKSNMKEYIAYLRSIDYATSKEEINHIIKNNICSSLEEIINQ